MLVSAAQQSESAVSIHISGLPRWFRGKEPACNAGAPGSVPGLGRSPGGGQSTLLQSSCLENPMDGEPGGLQSMGSHRVRHDWTTEHQHHSYTSSLSSLPLTPTPPLCIITEHQTKLPGSYSSSHYLFYTSHCIYVNPSFPIRPILFFTPYVHMFILSTKRTSFWS